MNQADGVGPPRTLRPLNLLAWVLAVWTLLTTIAATVAGYSALPYEDEWDTWLSYLRQGYSLPWFFALHNDHRIAAPRVLFAIDHLAFDGRRWFLLVSSFALQALLALLLWRLARRGTVRDRHQDPVLGAAIVCCLFSAQQALNFYWGFQVQFFMVYAAGAAALFALLRSAAAAYATRRRAWFAASLLLAVVCTYSMANGIFIWPVLLLTAVWLKVPRPGLALAAGGAVLLPALYFHGWHASKLDGAVPIARMMVFALANLGSPLVPLVASLGAGARVAVIATALAGAALLAGAAGAWVSLWRNRERFSSEQAVVAHFALFVAAASFAIASGRGHLPLDAAFRSRYITPPYIFWVCLLILAWPRLRCWHAPAPHAMVCAALLFGVAIHQPAKLREAARFGAGFHLGEAAVADGVSDPTAWLSVFRSAAEAAPAVDYLRAYRLSIFTERWTHWPGLPLASRFSIDRNPGACQGSFEEATPVTEPPQPGWRLSGQGRYPGASASPGFVVFADPAGTIAGVAPVAAGRWMGYVPSGPASITAYVVEPDGKTLCSLGSRVLGP
ncbi:MAG: hypothetical protein WB579_06250 [Bryobacteraceae bacterium]